MHKLTALFLFIIAVKTCANQTRSPAVHHVHSPTFLILNSATALPRFYVAKKTAFFAKLKTTHIRILSRRNQNAVVNIKFSDSPFEVKVLGLNVA